jgi:hypothetical protein
MRADQRLRHTTGVRYTRLSARHCYFDFLVFPRHLGRVAMRPFVTACLGN